MSNPEIKTLEKHVKVIRNEEDFLHTQIDGEAVIMNMETGAYFGLNSVATDLWNLMEKPISVQEVLDQIIAEYDVEKKACEEDTMPVLFQMSQLKIIVPSD